MYKVSLMIADEINKINRCTYSIIEEDDTMFGYVMVDKEDTAIIECYNRAIDHLTYSYGKGVHYL